MEGTQQEVKSFLRNRHLEFAGLVGEVTASLSRSGWGEREADGFLSQLLLTSALHQRWLQALYKQEHVGS